MLELPLDQRELGVIFRRLVVAWLFVLRLAVALVDGSCLNISQLHFIICFLEAPQMFLDDRPDVFDISQCL